LALGKILSTSSSGEHPSSVWPTDCFVGKQVLVCGGTSGIGAAVAASFVAAGAIVAFTGATAPEVEAASADPRLQRATGHVLDVADGEAVEKFVGGCPALHHLVNCAGIIRRGEEHDPAVFAKVIDVNLIGTMRVCATARPLLAAAGGGTIVNTASMLSFFGGGLVPGYAASKGGISQLTKSLAIAYAQDGIRVNAIAPGWIATPLTEGLATDPVRSEAILSRTPMKRWGRPEDICGGVLFLSSPLSSFVTGAILPIDGGYSSV
jgi:NAD(P)-dependent dehydrogenase (short-subunit alcohol dehydrogenase family)